MNNVTYLYLLGSTSFFECRVGFTKTTVHVPFKLICLYCFLCIVLVKALQKNDGLSPVKMKVLTQKIFAAI